ncbi:MAG: response regulator, partial [Nitrospira sp.]|nr:response regulator [Nitrospira sp.]
MAIGTMPSAVAVRGRVGVPHLHGTIVVVDDEEAIRTWFLELFRPQGVSIRVAASGQEAIAMVKQFPPALLIVDVTLPDRDGITVLEEALG